MFATCALEQALFIFREDLGHSKITGRILTKCSVYTQLPPSNFGSDTKRLRAQRRIAVGSLRFGLGRGLCEAEGREPPAGALCLCAHLGQDLLLHFARASPDLRAAPSSGHSAQQTARN